VNTALSSSLGQGFRRATWIRLAVIAALVVAGALLLHGRIDPTMIHEYAMRLNPYAAFALLVVLPLFGFPASVLHVAAGIRFGAGLGLLLTSISIGLQLLISYGVVRLWGGFFRKRLEPLRRRIPTGAHASIAVFAVLLPGAPFAAVNYVLPLIGIRLRTYLLCCWPIHTLRSTVTVLLGDQSEHFDLRRLTILGAYALLLAIASWWLYRRLRRQLANPPAEADGRMQPG
jgi:uncharacterized membrane protein YdjX (TVP38/TMEM64 family)